MTQLQQNIPAEFITNVVKHYMKRFRNRIIADNNWEMIVDNSVNFFERFEVREGI